jgi:hypothetical protein
MILRPCARARSIAFLNSSMVSGAILTPLLTFW